MLAQRKVVNERVDIFQMSFNKKEGKGHGLKQIAEPCSGASSIAARRLRFGPPVLQAAR